MRRRQFRKNALSVSLFPFLAVLICTMGALIVLLVMVVQQARVQAVEIAHEDAPDPLLPRLPSEDQRQAEDYEWQWEQLAQQRNQLTNELAGRRQELTDLESHIRQLEQRWKQLVAEAQQLQQVHGNREQNAGEQQQKIAELEAQIEQTKAAIEQLRERLAQQPRSYAIVPYRGPNATTLLPVFVECTAEGIWLQPEGILLRAADFMGPLGPGNPLDAALRAKRDYLAQAGIAGEAYPLLLVRPGGAESYAMARAAMKNWEDEFGYELIAEDMLLAYPDTDPQLVAHLNKAVADARHRQSILAQAMPTRYQDTPQVGYVASRKGGFVPTHRNVGQPTGQAGFGSGGDQRYRDGFRNPKDDSDDPSAVAPGQLQSDSDRFAGDGQAGGHQGATLQGPKVQPPAQQRGANWGLPTAAAGSTGITRPIRVAVLPDRLVILPERGVRQEPVTVMLNGPLQNDLDAFVSKIWTHMEGWGIAVLGGYWKPVLTAEVAEGGEERFAELVGLLRDSGIEIQRKLR